VKIEMIDRAPPEIKKKMREDWEIYDRAHGIDSNYKRFSMILSDYEGNTVGLLEAYTVFAEIYVDELWIDPNHRRKGFGSKLLHELEQQFEGKGFGNMNLHTSEYQAPEFYKKCGFELEFVRKNLKHPKLNKYFFVKYFKNEIQNQRIFDPESCI
jgi:ribosomal protein S18 acetylase RimI-like enzyme